jgi:hypothetical protein
MIDMQQLENIKQKHGRYASWAVWADASEKPKSNMGDVSHFKNESVLSLLKNDVVMVGLNISRPVSEPFTNFHDPNPRANDFKIRYAFKDSPYYLNPASSSLFSSKFARKSRFSPRIFAAVDDFLEK